MKTKYTKIFAGLAFASLALGTTGCNLDETNPNAFDANGFWKKQADFTGNLTALMEQWRERYDQNVLFYAGELRSGFYGEMGLDGSGLYNAFVVNNQLDYNNPQFSNYANFYGMISNCNTYLYYDGLRGESLLQPQERNYLLGMIYGMRAYCNFQIHKMWGTGPIRDDAMVIEGVYDETLLEKEQATPEEFLENIKKDIKLSLQHFEAAGSYSNTIFNSNGGQIYWRKATTEMLAGEVYLWSAKVSTMTSSGAGSHVATGAPDVATAKQYFQNVANNYGFKLMPSYTDAINVNGASNTERIFGTFYSITEKNTNWYNYIQYDPVVGGSPGNYWNCVEDDGVTPSTHGARLTYCYNPGEANIGTRGARTTFFLQRMTGQNRYIAKNAYYYQFDPEDSRTCIFQPIYCLTQEEQDNNIQNIENFDFEAHDLAGCYIWKYHGQLNTGTNVMVGSTYMTYYRLPLVYAYLAECANFEGNNADVEKYINLIRARAYADNWNESTYGYKAGSFADNEIAILKEKDKEFFQEGQRWWDLRRLTVVKGGTEADHLVFRPEGCMGYGLDLAAHPKWQEVRTNDIPVGRDLIVTDVPVLDYTIQKHMVLWPIDGTLLGKDEKLKQTPGYATRIGGENW